MTQDPHQDEAGEAYPAEKARQGYIVLKTPTRRVIFIAGLAGVVVLLLVLGVAS